MNDLLVSVVITTYKRDVSIVERAIKSIYNQTYSNFEIIIINDYPIDCDNNKKLLKMLEKYKKTKYIVVDKNGGACKARNIGLKEAKGQYIGFLDDDDEWLPTKIEDTIKEFQKNNDIAIIYSNSIVSDDDKNNKYSFHTSIQPSGIIFNELFSNNIIGSTSFPMFKKELLLSINGFNEEMPAMQDLELYLRFCKKYEALYIDKELSLYHLYEGDRITRNTSKRVKAYEIIFDEFKDDLNSNKNNLYNYNRKGINVYTFNRNYIKALKLLCKNIAIKPLHIKTNLIDLCKIIVRIFYIKNDN